MVQVLNKPCDETQPILSATGDFEAHNANGNQRKNSCAEEAYKNITNSMKADPLKIEDHIVALDLLETAVKLQNVPLARQCVEILDRLMDKKNVLTILAQLEKCKMPTNDPNDFQPSAPPIVENDNQRTENWVHGLIEDLRHNCLLEIDKNADFVLKQKEVLDLTYTDILFITTRDTLQVSNELIVYSAILRWAYEECRRRTLPTQPINIKAVLRDLVYAPRYGLMRKKDFLCRNVDGVKGPDRIDVLSDKETDAILKYITKSKKTKPIDQLPHKGSQPRIIGTEKPKPLSIRSRENNNSNLKEANIRCDRGTTCDKFLINFLTCWTAIFD